MRRKKPFRVGSVCLVSMRALRPRNCSAGIVPRGGGGASSGRGKKSLLGWLCAYRAKAEELEGRSECVFSSGQNRL